MGAVAAGKSTVAKLILADAALHPEKDLRITLVVSDTMSALNLADELNTLFCTWGEKPIAVPLIGRSTRHLHLQRLYRSSKFRSDHWALRWLNPACPLQALATEQAPYGVLPGKEPCESLYQPPKKSGGRKTYQYCPLFAVCPSKQLYHDMPTARIWITTPGALGKSSLPAQIERRKVHLTEIVYEQSDLVIFDEADTIQQWFDNLFAEEVILTNGSDGLLDVEDVETAQALVLRRTQPASTRRWANAERHSLASISNILSNLTDIEQGILLRRWVGRNYFTALTLAYKLAWRLLGLPKWEECLGQDRIEADKKAQRVVFHFDKLSQKDPMTLARPKGNAQNDPVYRLALIMRALIAAGDSAHNSAVREECQAWIEDFIPAIQQTLQKLAQETIAWRLLVDKGLPSDQTIPEPPDTLDTFAQRLEFVLSVMILDRNIRVVFYEWYNKPENMLTDLNESDEIMVSNMVYRSDIEDFAHTNGKILIAPLQAIGRGYNILNQHGKAAFGAIYFLTRPMPYPADTQSLARELNRRTLDWCKDTKLPLWQEPMLQEKAVQFRQKANEYWRKAELRSYYHTLKHEDEKNNNDTTYSERFDLAATTAGYIIQACGRLLRGGVPFHAFFVDAAWGPKRVLSELRTRPKKLTFSGERLHEKAQGVGRRNPKRGQFGAKVGNLSPLLWSCSEF